MPSCAHFHSDRSRRILLDGIRARQRPAIGVIFIYPIVFPIIYPVNQHRNIGRSFTVTRRITGNRVIGVHNTLTRPRKRPSRHARFFTASLVCAHPFSFVTPSTASAISAVKSCQRSYRSKLRFSDSRRPRLPYQTGPTVVLQLLSSTPGTHLTVLLLFDLTDLVLRRVTYFLVPSKDMAFKSDFVIGHAPHAHVCGYWSGRHFVRCYFRRPPQNCRSFSLCATTKS